MSRWLFWGLALAVTALSLTPVQYLPPPVFDVWDKAQHAAAFTLLTVAGRWAYPAFGRPASSVALLLHGAATEAAQAATGWRHGELADWVADAVGIAIGYAVLAARARWRAFNAPTCATKG
ncbi:VanZ family protein [Tepidimonas charontis]|uniref:VanZ family protein n=1 Tax=Tepidimonas charontis TaxID=2267262 RepID=UPI00191C04A8|nr:VanZ family protein [Tepidimonas charontis]